jgi:HK97 family phage prohead protease
MLDYKRVDFKLEAGAKEGIIKGYGSVFGNVDSHGDVIVKGAFKDTLREWEDKGKFPPMLLQHGGGMFGGTAMDGVPIGVWSMMEENAKGLRVEGQLLAMDTPDVRRIYEAMKAGSLDGLSIGYMVKSHELGTKPGEPKRKLTGIDLWELSVVTFPSNDRARVSGVKANEMLQGIHTLADAERFLRDVGMSKSVATSFVSRLKQIARSESDDDQLAKLLSSLKGVNSTFQH